MSSTMWFILIVFLCISSNEASLIDRELPCHFVDSIDISTGVHHFNNSITFNGMMFPEHQYAKVNYILKDGTKPVIVEPYVRGCPCNIKPCIRLCCPFGSFVKTMTPEGSVECSGHETVWSFDSDIIHGNNQSKVVDLHQHFGFVDRLCKLHFYADEFKITNNGNVLFENELVHHREYCLQVSKSETNETHLDAMICYEKPDDYHVRYSILPYTMIISVPLILLTFLVYVCIPELLNLLGKCLLCYLTSLVMFYILLSYVYLMAGRNVPPNTCTTLAYLIYFSYLSSSLWLNVISFDLWMSFRSTIRPKKSSDRKQFCVYMLYVWSLSIILTLVAGGIDTINSLPNYLKPGFGTENCFLKEERISKFLYFFMPIGILFVVNIIFFILTALKIIQVQKEMDYFRSAQEENGKHQNKFNRKTYSFSLYLRLFIIMGVTWSMDAIAFVSPDNVFFLISDICNALQGVFIFILFVMKRRVLNLIQQRWNHLFGKDVENQLSATNFSTTSTKSNNVRLKELSPLAKK